MEATDTLAGYGFRTLEAYNLEMVLDVLSDYGEDIRPLFTDVSMRGPKDGFQLARTAHQLFPFIKILVASGLAIPEDGDLPDEAVFVRKPFSAEVVGDRFKELMPEHEQSEPLKARRARA